MDAQGFRLRILQEVVGHVMTLAPDELSALVMQEHMDSAANDEAGFARFQARGERARQIGCTIGVTACYVMDGIMAVLGESNDDVMQLILDEEDCN